MPKKKQKQRQRKQRARQQTTTAPQPTSITQSAPTTQSAAQPPALSQPSRSLRAFVGLTLLALAPMFAIWYLLGGVLLAPVAWLSNFVLPLFYPHAIEAVELQSRSLDIVTHFNYAPPNVQIPAGMVPQYVFWLEWPQIPATGCLYLLALIVAFAGAYRTKIILRSGWVWTDCASANVGHQLRSTNQPDL